MNHLFRATSACLLAISVTAFAPAQRFGVHDRVFVETNDAANNGILVFDRAHDGTLTWSETVSTGGKGSGGGIGQGALALSGDGRLLYAVNAGSNEISVFAVTDHDLILIDKVGSDGTSPISITAHDDLVYVLNAGGTKNFIAGFRWSFDDGLRHIHLSNRDLSAATPTPVEVAFNPSGDFLVVSEKGTNTLDVFPVDSDGRTGHKKVFASSGTAPFGFAFGHHDALLVSEAANSAASSYLIDHDGRLHLESGSVLNGQKAACWAAATHNGKYVYTANAGNGTLSGYSVDPSGTISLLDPSGLTATTDPHPIDMATTRGDKFLYVVSNVGGAIDEFAINSDGSLTGIGSLMGLPTSISGIAVR